MGIYDRDYYRQPARGGFGAFQTWSVTTWLIVVNVAVFILDEMSDRALTGWGYFSVASAIWNFQFWRFITFQFLHASIGHIFFNMLGLYFFGPIVEAHLGARRFLSFYLSCGIAGALCFLTLWGAHVLVGSADQRMVGASAGIFGILLGAAKIAPNITVTLWFPPIPLTLRTLAWGYLAIAVYAVLTGGANPGGQAAHIGGGLWGFFLIGHEHWLNFLVPSRRPAQGRPRRRVMFRDWTRDQNH